MKTDKSILVAGAGSIGTVLGMLLQQKNLDVELLRRNPQSKRMQISMIGRENFACTMNIHSSSSSSIKKISPDIIFITSQAQQTEALMEFIINKVEISHSTIFITLQNGLTAPSIIYEKFKQLFNRTPIIIQGVIWWSATLIDEKSVLYHKKAKTVIGIPKQSAAQSIHLDMIYNMLSNILEVQKTSDILSESRRKLILNVVSPALALTNQPYPSGLNIPIIRKIVHAMFDEAMEIAQKEKWLVDDKQLIKFHQILASTKKIPQNENLADNHHQFPNFVHKVSTQISAEKHGGKLSNAQELLSYFVKRGAIICKIILEKVEELPKNYHAIPILQLEEILKQNSVKSCKFIKTNDINKFNYK